MAKRTPTDESKPRTKFSQSFDDDLIPRIKAGAEAADLSVDRYVQRLVVRGLTEADRKKRSKSVTKNGQAMLRADALPRSNRA